MRGDRMLARTSEYISSGNMNISISESVAAEDFSSVDIAFIFMCHIIAECGEGQFTCFML